MRNKVVALLLLCVIAISGFRTSEQISMMMGGESGASLL